MVPPLLWEVRGGPRRAQRRAAVTADAHQADAVQPVRARPEARRHRQAGRVYRGGNAGRQHYWQPYGGTSLKTLAFY